MELKLPVLNFRKLWNPLRSCPLFKKFLKLRLFSPLKNVWKFKLEFLREWKALSVNVPMSQLVRLSSLGCERSGFKINPEQHKTSARAGLHRPISRLKLYHSPKP